MFKNNTKEIIEGLQEDTWKNTDPKEICKCELDGFLGAMTARNCPIHFIEQPQIGDRHDVHYAQYDCILKYPHSGDCQIEKVIPFTRDQKEMSIKQCPKCLTMKSFEGESCARCNVKGESASIEEAKDLAWLLVGGITFGDSRDTPEWRKTILESAERIILEYFQRVGVIKGERNRLIEMAREEERKRIYKIGMERIKWHQDTKNQWAGVIHANTSINAIQSLLDYIIPPTHGQQ